MMDLSSNETQAIINITEPDQPVKISITLPRAIICSNIHGIDQVHKKVKELTPMITSLAIAAFVDKNKEAWNIIQTILYYWNYRDLLRVDRIKDDTPLVENALRKIVLDIQKNSLVTHELECANSFTPELAVEELADKVFSHRINNHPLLMLMAEQGINQRCLTAFLENYYVNNRLFHLFIAALSFSTPMTRRTELACNFYDELGAGDNSLAHPVLFFKNFNTIGKPTSIVPFAESLYLVNEKTWAAFLSGDYHFGMGGFGYIELAMPNQMRKILAGLEKSGLPRRDLEFWETHITIDEEHGKTWFSEMLHLIKTVDHAQKCLNGGMRLLDARAAMYDGALRFQ